MPERVQSLTWTWGPSMCHHASPQHNWVASVNHLHHQKLARDFWPRWTCEHALHVSGDVASIIFELENCKKMPFSEARCETLSTPFFSTGCYGFSMGWMAQFFFRTCFNGYPRVPCTLLRVFYGFPSKSSKQWFCSIKKFKMGLKRCCQMNPILMQRVDSGIRVGKAYCPKKAMQTLLLKPDTYQKRHKWTINLNWWNYDYCWLIYHVGTSPFISIEVSSPPFGYPMPFLLKEPFAGFPSCRRGCMELTWIDKVVLTFG